MNAAIVLPVDDIDRLIDDHLPAARRGDREAYARIVIACQNPVTAIALAIVRDVPASEDIAQEAFLKAWQGLDTLKNHASFLPWLRQITRNLARDYLRASRHRPMTGEGAEVAINMAADAAPTPVERLILTEQETAAADIISALPEDSRETLLLYYREGQRSKQVAALLGLSDAAVRKRLSRAREQVRAELLERFGEFARGSAPGAAFTAVVVGALAMSSPAISAAAVIGSGVLGGSAGKLGASAVASTVSGGVAGGSLGVAATQLFGNAHAVSAMLGGVLGGAIGFGFTWWYLMRFARDGGDRRRISRFMTRVTLTGALWALALMASSLGGHGRVLPIVVMALGLALVNYQWLVPLPRLMAPMLADPANAHRRACYERLMGRRAVWLSSMMALAALVFARWMQG